ncbi:hypothetical protein AD998_07195 [bacterium 336/3]|nr:hypothetical protein AD998_07195 [bacterium 336/3]
MKYIFTVLLLIGFSAYGQEDLLKELENGTKDTTAVFSTFKGTRIINLQSIENPASKDLIFLISHRFGRLNEGISEFFGLDQATIRLGLEYGINDNIAVGLGRSSLNKTLDGFVKIKLLKQTADNRIPLSVSWFSSMAANTLSYTNPAQDDFLGGRMAYTHQLLLARKFSSKFSLQVSPTIVHRNLVNTPQDPNRVFAVAMGGRYKFTKRLAITAEYIPTFTDMPNNTQSVSLGLDIETGGHVFQLHFTNSQGMIDRYFVPETTGLWEKGDIYFGFNVARVFTLGKR